MSPLLLAAAILMNSPSIRFERHEIDKFPAGYQVAVADLNGDGRLDVIALSTDASRVDWYENPTWKRRPVARVDKPIDLAVYDLDGDGKPELALAGGFYFGDSSRGGQIQWLKPRTLTPGPSPGGRGEEAGKGDRSNLPERPFGCFAQIGPVPFSADFDEPWEIHPIAVDPVTHRLRWADLDGDGKKELVHAPIFGPGSKANFDPKPSHLWAFRVPKDPVKDPWPVVKIDETLTVLHGLCVVSSGTRIGTEPSPPTPLPKGEGSYWRRDQLLTASYEGIFKFYAEGAEEEKGDRSNLCEAPGGPFRQIGPVPFFRATLRFRKEPLSAGEKPADQKPGAARGSSEVAYGRLGPEQALVAAIEPWHGNEVVVYLTRSPSSRPETGSRLDRNAPSPPAPLPERALTLALSQRERGGVVGRPASYRRLVLDDTFAEGHALVVADFDGDGQDEIVAGWRAGGGGLNLYKWGGGESDSFRKIPLDRGIAVEGAVAADLNGDGRLDLVAIAGRTNNLVWYENKGSGIGD